MKPIATRHAIAALLTAAACGTSAQATDDRPCADQNLDGRVTPSDFNSWILNFNAGSPLADVNGDGEITPGDFNGWILAYNQFPDGPGCPADVVSGLQIEGSISFLGDRDAFLLQADAGDDIRVAISEPTATSFSPRLSIVAPDGSVVTATWDTFGFDLTAANVPTSGTYTLVVQDNGDDNLGSYRLTAIVPDSTVDIGNESLPSGTTLTRVVGLGDIDTFTINAQAGDDVRLAIAEAGGSSNFSPAVNIYAPNGDRVTGTWDTFGFDLTAASVPVTGTYTIVVQDNSGSQSGDYTLTTLVPDGVVDVNDVALPSGTTITREVGLGDIDTFTINAQAGDDIRLAIAEAGGSSNFSPAVNIYAPNGDRVTGTWDTFGFDLTAANVPVTGTYTIVVQDNSGSQSGDYTLTALVPDDVVDTNDVALASGMTVTDTVNLGDIDTFTIAANAGDDIRLAIAEAGGSSSFSPAVNIYAPNGDRVTGTWDTFGFDLTAANVPVSGTYTIVVQDNSGTQSGDYAMTVVVPDNQIDAGNVPLPDGATRSGLIDLGDIDTFTITLSAGQDLTIDVAELGSASSFSPRASIYAPNGDLITGTWDTFSFSLSRANVPFSGAYTIVVQDNSGTSSGDYQIGAIVSP
ncbi:MAG: GC-type dockerin domain-anchored protein [Planctomycetota bacterium]